jgi:tRNA A-37 threonylcarbamoyl transferase component Bud32
MQFEYKISAFEPRGISGSQVDIQAMERALNTSGEEAWELVGTFSTSQFYGKSRTLVAVMKRAKAARFTGRGADTDLPSAAAG